MLGLLSDCANNGWDANMKAKSETNLRAEDGLLSTLNTIRLWAFLRALKNLNKDKNL